MTFNDVFKKFNEIFIDVLDDEEIVLKESSTANDIEEWDSLSHIQLIVNIEKEFGVNFTALEMENYSNVGEMCRGVLGKLI